MPQGTVYVGRPTKWGNPWEVARWHDGIWFVHFNRNACRSHWPEGYQVPYGAMPVMLYSEVAAIQTAYDLFERNATDKYQESFRELVRTELAGLNLACWCPLDAPCHADVLGRIANGEEWGRDG